MSEYKNTCARNGADTVLSAPCADDGWVTLEGEFNAIMAVVMPCRSDRSDSGLVPFAHMADGRIHLILVRKCSTLQYLKFLASIPRSGVLPENFDYVEAVDAIAVRVEPQGARLAQGANLGSSRYPAQIRWPIILFAIHTVAGPLSLRDFKRGTASRCARRMQVVSAYRLVETLVMLLAGRESVWSVDGELLANNHISANVYRGLVDVFGRGIE